MNKPAPEHKRHCQTCGEKMMWLPLTNVWSVVYRWRAWCREHGFATRSKKEAA